MIAITSVVAIACCVLFNLSFRIPTHSPNTKAIAKVQLLPWSPVLNLKQTGSDCGSYSTMAFLYAVKQEVIDPKTINAKISAKTKEGTQPWGITSYLLGHGVVAKAYWLGFREDKFRLNWIKEKIANGFPVILLVGDGQGLHYITILGYSDTHFYIFDSNADGVAANQTAGNVTMPYDKLLDWWKSAAYRSIRTYLAISQ